MALHHSPMDFHHLGASAPLHVNINNLPRSRMASNHTLLAYLPALPGDPSECLRGLP